MKPKVVIEPWAVLDEILKDSPYTRFSIDTYRNFDDARKRQWHAVLFKEKGQLLASAYGATRDLALGALLEAYRAGSLRA